MPATLSTLIAPTSQLPLLIDPAAANIDNMARRSARAAAAAVTTAVVASSIEPTVRIPGHRRPPAVGSTDAAIQALLLLPGFAWEEDLSW